MSIELSSNLGDVEFDGLVTDVKPAVLIGGGTLSATTETTFARGTLMARDGTALSAYAGTGTVDSILCDEITVAAGESENVTVYIAGCFDQNKVEEASDYELTDDDIAALRGLGIVFKSAQEV